MHFESTIENMINSNTKATITTSSNVHFCSIKRGEHQAKMNRITHPVNEEKLNIHLKSLKITQNTKKKKPNIRTKHIKGQKHQLNKTKPIQKEEESIS